ncbi:tripartite tricarboxylate transporter substrate-binding protein [Bradyrhizobium sp. 2S1]
MLRRISLIAGACLAWLATADVVRAQDFPSRPIRIVIPYAPGSVADVFARIVAQDMQEQWKGTIVVEAKSGANGSIAAEEVVRAAPDGYTWLLERPSSPQARRSARSCAGIRSRTSRRSARFASRRTSSSCRPRCR